MTNLHASYRDAGIRAWMQVADEDNYAQVRDIS